MSGKKIDNECRERVLQLAFNSARDIVNLSSRQQMSGGTDGWRSSRL
jgi:hypothetical protein